MSPLLVIFTVMTEVRKVGPCQPHEVQQGKVQGPASGLGQSQAETQVGQRMAQEQP